MGVCQRVSLRVCQGRPLGGAFRHFSTLRRFNFLPHLPATFALFGRGTLSPVGPLAYRHFRVA